MGRRGGGRVRGWCFGGRGRRRRVCWEGGRRRRRRWGRARHLRRYLRRRANDARSRSRIQIPRRPRSILVRTRRTTTARRRRPRPDRRRRPHRDVRLPAVKLRLLPVLRRHERVERTRYLERLRGVRRAGQRWEAVRRAELRGHSGAVRRASPLRAARRRRRRVAPRKPPRAARRGRNWRAAFRARVRGRGRWRRRRSCRSRRGRRGGFCWVCRGGRRAMGRRMGCRLSGDERGGRRERTFLLCCALERDAGLSRAGFSWKRTAWNWVW